MGPWRAAAGVLLAALAAGAQPLPKLPEPLLGESITDLDAPGAGELELDLTAHLLAPRAGREGGWGLSLEAEWRALDRLGLALEVGLAGEAGGPALALRPGASFALLADPARQVWLQAEVTARLLDAEEAAGPGEPGEAARAVAAGLRGGLRLGAWTLRGALGAGLGGPSVHAVPARAQLALLRALGPGGAWGFWGAEVEADWARRAPFWVAPQLVLDGAPLGVPARLGLALTAAPPGGGEPWRLGALVRILFELDAD